MKTCAICDKKFHKGVTLTLTVHRVSEPDITATYEFCHNDMNSVAEFFRMEVASASNS